MRCTLACAPLYQELNRAALVFVHILVSPFFMCAPTFAILLLRSGFN